VSSALVDHSLELLAPLGAVRARRMFGGHGIYLDDLFIAIVAFERLYLKADAASQPAFADAGCERFTYEAQGKTVSLNYWTVPAEAMESPALMQPWARQAIAAALRARAAKPSAPARKARATTARPAPAASRSRR
jgi:DNA transformation protein and related proteins